MSRTLSRVLWVIGGIVLIALGIFIIARPAQTISSLSILLGVVMLISGISTMFTFFTFPKGFSGKIWVFIESLISIVLAIFIWANLFISTALITIFFGVWIFISGIMRIITSVRIKKAGFVSWWVILIFGIVSALLGVAAFFNPMVAAVVVSIIIGSAVILLGVLVIGAGFIFS